MKQFFTIITINVCLFVTSCNNHSSMVIQQNDTSVVVPTAITNNNTTSADTTAIVQAVLDSKILDEKFYSQKKPNPVFLYTRSKYQCDGKDSIYGDFYTTDSVFMYKGKLVKISTTPCDDNDLVIKLRKFRPESTAPPEPKPIFRMSLIRVNKIEKEEAWFNFCFENSHEDITAHLRKINGKWEVIDYKATMY